MAGGQAFTSSAGSVGRAITLALVGIAVTLSQGTATANNENVVALTGQSVTVSPAPLPVLVTFDTDGDRYDLETTGEFLVSGTSGPQVLLTASWGQALTGSATTSAVGTPTVDMRPTNIVGQAMPVGQGIASAQSSNVTVNISGVESAFSPGDVSGGANLLTGTAIASAQGAPAYGLELPLSGIAVVSAAGTIVPNQDADDTLIISGSGTTAGSIAIPLTGVAGTAQQGSVGITGDVVIVLVGVDVFVMPMGATAAFLVHDGDDAYYIDADGYFLTSGPVRLLVPDKQFGLTGSALTVVNGSLGAPGGVTLSGSVVTATAGNVSLNNDKTVALTGVQATVSAGEAVTSYLAFVSGLELAVSAQVIGPIVVALTGQAITAIQGEITPPRLSQGIPPHDTRFNRPKFLRLFVLDEEEEVTEEELPQAIQKLAKIAVATRIDGSTKPPAIKILGASRDQGREIRHAFRQEFAKDIGKLQPEKKENDEEMLLWLL